MRDLPLRFTFYVLLSSRMYNQKSIGFLVASVPRDQLCAGVIENRLKFQLHLSLPPSVTCYGFCTCALNFLLGSWTPDLVRRVGNASISRDSRFVYGSGV